MKLSISSGILGDDSPIYHHSSVFRPQKNTVQTDYFRNSFFFSGTSLQKSFPDKTVTLNSCLALEDMLCCFFVLFFKCQPPYQAEKNRCQSEGLIGTGSSSYQLRLVK